MSWDFWWTGLILGAMLTALFMHSDVIELQNQLAIEIEKNND
jgi:hypothetical protein